MQVAVGWLSALVVIEAPILVTISVNIFVDAVFDSVAAKSIMSYLSFSVSAEVKSITYSSCRASAATSGILNQNLLGL